MRDLRFRLWSKIAQHIIPWNDVKNKPHTIFNTADYESMQFTGLVDTHGIDIYEGDIIESTDSSCNPIRHLVSYKESEACFCAKFIPENEFNSSCGITQGWVNDFSKRVVGNSYENEDLLS